MNDLVINVNWEYFLGIVGTLIGLAYYANGRLTKLETSVEWLKDAMRDLTLRAQSLAGHKTSRQTSLSRRPRARGS